MNPNESPRSVQARQILQQAFIDTYKLHPWEPFPAVYERVSRLWDCQPWHVIGAVEQKDYEFKERTARKIIRAQMAHDKAARINAVLEKLPITETYKGKR